ncbi:MAG: YceI family protein [Bacteroidota bacterium]
MKNIILGVLAICLLSSFSLSVDFASWAISDEYQLQFDTKKATGNFATLEGTINFDPENLEASNFDMWVDVSTIETGNKTKNKHAVGKKWFDAEQFPKITFQSTAISRQGEQYETTGTLTIRDISTPVTFPFSFTGDANSGVFEGSFSIDRKAFGLNGPALYGGLVGKEVTVNIKVPVTIR